MPLLGHLRRDYHYEAIDAETEVYAVIGDPVAQSLSPALHNAAFRHLGLNKVYVPILIPGGKLKEALGRAGLARHQGLQRHDPPQGGDRPPADQGRRRRRADEGVQHGRRPRPASGSATTPTTARRWTRWRRRSAASRADGTSPLLDKQVLILGAGGVARTIAFGATRRGAGVIVCNRSDERAVASGRGGRLPERQLDPARQHALRRPGQLHPGRHAPEPRRHAGPPGGLPAWHGRLRHDLPPREHPLPEARPRARMPDHHRRRHVRRPGRRPVPPLHRDGRAGRS